MSEWLTPPQIADRLGVEPEKVRGWIERGELVAVNLADRSDGRPRYKVSESELQAFLERRRRRPAVKTQRKPEPAAVTTAAQFFEKWGV